MGTSIKIIYILIVTVLFSCSSSTSQENESKNFHLVKNDKCDNPEAEVSCCFSNMPASLSNVMVIAGATEPGERLIIAGKILKKDGLTPYDNVLIYAYHTDSKGFYSKAGNEKGFQKWHGKLHGWCRTGPGGNYEIHTIRPASYPNSSAPAHIHAAIQLPDTTASFYISDFIFSDDPFVTRDNTGMIARNPGGDGIVDLNLVEGVWNGNRNIILDIAP